MTETQHVEVLPAPQYEPALGSEPTGDTAAIWARYLATPAAVDHAEDQ
ncbi:hypothetical protein ACFWBG_24510 [Nocardia salmonicida]|nr:hypothetical protein [Nocardia sp. PE-7]WKG11710.1 hypothetical protein QX204_09730 [Nocardia sp. PE-7]